MDTRTLPKWMTITKKKVAKTTRTLPKWMTITKKKVAKRVNKPRVIHRSLYKGRPCCQQKTKHNNAWSRKELTTECNNSKWPTLKKNKTWCQTATKAEVCSFLNTPERAAKRLGMEWRRKIIRRCADGVKWPKSLKAQAEMAMAGTFEQWYAPRLMRTLAKCVGKKQWAKIKNSPTVKGVIKDLINEGHQYIQESAQAYYTGMMQGELMTGGELGLDTIPSDTALKQSIPDEYEREALRAQFEEVESHPQWQQEVDRSDLNDGKQWNARTIRYISRVIDAGGIYAYKEEQKIQAASRKRRQKYKPKVKLMRVYKKQKK